MPGELADDADRQAVLWIGADKRVLHKKFAVLRMGHHPFFQRIELLLRKIFVYVAPENFIFAAGFAHDGFVFGGTPGVFACVDEYRRRDLKGRLRCGARSLRRAPEC